MFAIVKAGGHQYTVSQGDVITVDYLQGKEGDLVTLDQVLLVNDGGIKLGKPVVPGAKVEAVIKTQSRSPKVIVFKYLRTKNSKVTKGHKQPITTLEITKIHH